MADDKTKTKQDRKLVAETQDYEVRYFAKRHGITRAQARAIIAEHGPSREACDAAAANLSVGGAPV